MSDSKTESEESLEEMPEYLRFFSLAMRSLYSDKNPGTSTDVSGKFTKLRNDTRQDAKVYSKVILPFTTKFVSVIKDFFDYYDALSYEEWCESLPDILEKIKANKDYAETLREMHEEIIVPLKKREDEAKIIMTEFKDLQTEFENATKKLESKAETKRNWAFAFALIPGVNFIATPLLLSYANADSKKAIAKIKESEINEAAVLVVAKALIPALDNFIKGLTKAAGFFQIMEIEMNSFEEKGNEIKKSHYKILKKKVQKINPSCHKFYTELPAIRTDFETIPDIPDKEAQQNHIVKWLEERVKEIKKKSESTRKHFWDVIEKIPGISSSQILTSSSLEPIELR